MNLFSEEINDKLEQISNFGTVYCDLIKEQATLSKNMAVILGVKQSANEPIINFIIQEDIDKYIYAKEHVLEKSNKDHFEMVFRIKDTSGNVKWLKEVSHITRDKDGVANFLSSYFYNVTNKNENYLDKNSFESFNTYESEMSGIFHLNVKMDSFSLDDNGLNIFGIDKVDYDGTQNYLRDYVHPDDARNVYESMKGILEEKTSNNYVFSTRILRNNGEIRYIRISGWLNRNEEGVITDIHGIISDITKEKTAHIELIDKEIRYNLALDAANAGTYYYEVENDKNYWDSRTINLFGLEENCYPTCYDGWLKHIHSEDVEYVDQIIQEKLKSTDENSFSIEYRAKRPDNDYRHFIVTGRIVRDELNNATHVAGIHYDNTEQKIYDKKLRDSEKKLNHALNAANAGKFYHDFNEKKTEWDERSYKIFGVEPTGDYLDNDVWFNCLHPEDRVGVEKHLDEILVNTKNNRFSLDYRIITPDGEIKYINESGWIIRNNEGLPTEVTGLNIDMTKRKLQEQKLIDMKQRLELALSAANAGIYVYDLDTEIFECDDTIKEMYGIDDTYKGSFKEWLNFVYYKDKKSARQFWINAIKSTLTNFNYRYRIVDSNNNLKYLDESFSIVRDKNGKALLVTGLTLDVSEQAKREKLLLEYKSRLDLALDSARAGTFFFNLDKNQAVYDERACEIFGFNLMDNKIPHEVWENAVHPEDFNNVDQIIWNAINGTEDSFNVEYRIIRDDDVRYIKTNGTIIRNNLGEPKDISGLHFDITNQKLNENKLLYIEQIDEVTGILNKKTFYDMATDKVEKRLKNNKHVSLITFNVDDFSKYNRSYGRYIADKILNEVVYNTKLRIRKSDLFGRTESDEFMILIPDKDLSYALTLADRIRVMLKNTPFKLGNQNIYFTASFGVASSSKRVKTFELLVKQSSKALLKAKKNGKNSVEYMREKMFI